MLLRGDELIHHLVTQTKKKNIYHMHEENRWGFKCKRICFYLVFLIKHDEKPLIWLLQYTAEQYCEFHKCTYPFLEHVQNDFLLTPSSGNLVCTTLMGEGSELPLDFLSRSLSVQEQDTVDYTPASSNYTWETGLGLGCRTQVSCSTIFKTLI